jgi:hypothetical protein
VIRYFLLLVSAAVVLLAPPTASAHGVPPAGATVVQDTLWLVPVGGSLPSRPLERVISARQTIVAQLPVTDPGEYELALVAAGQAGNGEARVPVTIAQQPFVWIVAVIPAALGAFVLLLFGATVLRLRRPTSPRLDLALTSSLALCALVALSACVATQFIP